MIRAVCPRCFRRAVSATDPVGDQRPYSGDYACCTACGEFAVFDFTRRANVMRRPTPREIVDIGKNESAKICRARFEQQYQRQALQ